MSRSIRFFASIVNDIAVLLLLLVGHAAASSSDVFVHGPFTDHQVNVLFDRSICTVDDSLWAKCYANSHPEVYTKSKATLRIRRNGRAHCTAWLVGAEGHVLTNNHCVKDPLQTTQVQFEAMAEGSSCNTTCASSLGCAGTIIHDEPLTFIKTGGSLQEDWTLLQLPQGIRSQWVEELGYLTLRASGPIVGERIYVPQHPRGFGKKIAMKDGEQDAVIIATDRTAGCGIDQVIYRADTQGGSSGSPVIAMSDHNVVAIHHCGGCYGPNGGNAATHMSSMFEGLHDVLPPSAFA